MKILATKPRRPRLEIGLLVLAGATVAGVAITQLTVQAGPEEGVQSRVTRQSSVSYRSSSSDGHLWQATWGGDGWKFNVTLEGDVEFSADDHSILYLSPGGEMTIRMKEGRDVRSVEIEPTRTGELAYRYAEGGVVQPFQPAGQQWLARILPDVIRASGIGAEQRVSRILGEGGVDAVLDEIEQIPTDGIQTRYLIELAAQAEFSDSEWTSVLDSARRNISSDGDKSRMLIFLIQDERPPDHLFPQLLDVARTIASDGDLSRTLIAALDARSPRLGPELLASVFETAKTIGSDGDKSRVLIRAMDEEALVEPALGVFLEAAESIGSDGDLSRVMIRAFDRQPDGLSWEHLLEVVTSIGSDGDLSRVLIHALKTVDGSPGPEFFKATQSIGSAGDRGRVLIQAMNGSLDHESAMALLESAGGVGSSGDRARVLLMAARTFTDPTEREEIRRMTDRLASSDSRRVRLALDR